MKDGLWIHYYPNGKKRFEGRYIQGNPDGKHRIFYDDGKLKEDQYWEMGLRNRTWRKFDREGTVLISTTYENDVVIKINGSRVDFER